MPKMTSTLTEMEIVIWQRFYNGEDIKTITSLMSQDYMEFSEDVIENTVKRIYLKDFRTD